MKIEQKQIAERRKTNRKRKTEIRKGETQNDKENEKKK